MDVSATGAALPRNRPGALGLACLRSGPLSLRFGGWLLWTMCPRSAWQGDRTALIPGLTGPARRACSTSSPDFETAGRGDLIRRPADKRSPAPRAELPGHARTLQGLGDRGVVLTKCLRNAAVGLRCAKRPGFASALLGFSRSDRYEAVLTDLARDQLRLLGIERFADRAIQGAALPLRGVSAGYFHFAHLCHGLPSCCSTNPRAG